MCVANEVWDFLVDVARNRSNSKDQKTEPCISIAMGAMSKEEPPKKRCSELCGSCCFVFLFCFRFSCLWFSVAGAAKIYEHMWFCVWQVWQEYMWSVACLWAWQVWPKYMFKKLVLVRARGRCGKNNVCVAGLAIRHGVSVSVLVAGAVITIWVYVSMQTEAVVWKALHSHLRHSHHGTFSH